MHSQGTFYLFQRLTFCFRHHPPNKHQLKHHHHGKEHKSMATAEFIGYVRERKCNDSCHYPVSKAAKRLSLCTNLVREYFGNKYPNHSTLREGKESNVDHQQISHIVSVNIACIKGIGYQSKRNDKSQ